MKRTFAVGIGALVLLSLLALHLWAGEIDTGKQFLLLATKKTSTMQKELNQAAAAGYRIIAGSRTSGTEMALLLESVAEPPNIYEYQLLATSRTGTMNKELNQAAAEGFRLLPSTLMQKKRSFGAMEIVMVLEKAPNSKEKVEYKLLATSRTGTLQTEIMEATEEGFRVVAMVSRGEHIAILERPAPLARGYSSGPSRRYLAGIGLSARSASQ